MNSRIKRSTDDFNMRTNQLLSTFDFIKSTVKRKLLNLFCMAVYGSQLWDYSTNAPEAFYTTWRKCLRRIDGLPNKTHKIISPVLWDVQHVQYKAAAPPFQIVSDIYLFCLTLFNISRHNVLISPNIHYNLTRLLTMLTMLLYTSITD